MLCHTQMECLQTEVQQERVLGSGNRAEVAHQLSHELGGKAHLTEGFHVGQSVIRLIGGAETGELLGIGHPVEVTAIHHDTTHLSGQSVHILRGRVGHDVGAPFEGTAVDWCGEGVVHDEGHPVLMGDLGKALDVEHGATRIRDSLTKHRLRVRTESCLYLLVGGLL